jgi:hypothetical protein
MIFLRATAVDNDNTGAVDFVAVQQPIGVEDGDLLVCCVAVDQNLSSVTGLIVTPPDASWTLAAHSDRAGKIVNWVFWKYAINEPPRWVFSLSTTCDAQGIVAIYGGADGWQPVEAINSVLTDSSEATTSYHTPSSATSLNAEELVLFAAGEGAHSFTAPAGYELTASVQNQGTLAFLRQNKDAAGPVPAGTITYSVTGNGETTLVILRPSAATLSLDDVQGLLVGGLPTDANRVYDLDPGGDYYKLFRSIALASKQVLFDLVELARLEIAPRYARYKLPDWERVFGLTTTRTAQVGTVPARQNQVVSRWREAAGLGSTLDAISVVLGPLLGYNPTTPVQVLTTDRNLLRIEHSYEKSETVAGGSSLLYNFTPVDGGMVSKGGARVQLEWGGDYTAYTGQVDVYLTAPDGAKAHWVHTFVDDRAMDWLWSESVATNDGDSLVHVQQGGGWQLEVANNTSGSIDVIATAFIEGVQVDHLAPRQETAAAMFDWGAYADPAHLSESGVPADFTAARQALKRIAFAHTNVNLIQSIDPYPDVDSGLHGSIPDECIPT